MTGTSQFELVEAAGRALEWRFTASNNYVLAVGGDRMADVAAARVTLAGLQLVLPDACAATYQDPSGRWRWDLRSSGAVLAKSCRWYHSRTVCESTLAQFLHDAPQARVVNTGKLLRKVVDLGAACPDQPFAAGTLAARLRWFGRSR